MRSYSAVNKGTEPHLPISNEGMTEGPKINSRTHVAPSMLTFKIKNVLGYHTGFLDF